MPRFAANKAAMKLAEKAAKHADTARRRGEVQQKFAAMTEEEREAWRQARQAKRQDRRAATGNHQLACHGITFAEWHENHLKTVVGRYLALAGKLVDCSCYCVWQTLLAEGSWGDRLVHAASVLHRPILCQTTLMQSQA